MSQVYRLALLGDPVAQSRSPAIHAAALSISGLTGEYKAITANQQVLERTLADLQSGVMDGINVTMPLKRIAFELADDTTLEGRLAGSVNTLRRGEGGLVLGHSTDAVAFREIFEDDEFKDLNSVLVLGAGGSAAAALAASGGRIVYLSARTPGTAQALAETFDSVGVIPWGASVAGALVVNATPLGMSGERLPDRVVDLAGALVDLPYADTATPATTEAIGRGLPAVDGLEFLARQAAASFLWWTGENVDSAKLAEIARNV
ncbi:MAG: shikimate dehydrogenase [Actinobacteria bacterium]|nr:shikimate dehydrogenase [Actinomycetota bacterium]